MMPLSGFLTAAASFLYAVSSLVPNSDNGTRVSSFGRSISTQPVQENLPLLNLSSIYNKWSMSGKGGNDDGGRRKFFVPEGSNDEVRDEVVKEEDRRMRGLIRNLLFISRQNTSTRLNLPTLPQEYEVTFYEGQAIAVLQTDFRSNISRCRLIEVIDPKDRERVLEHIAKRGKIIERASFDQMLAIITACQSLEPAIIPPESDVIYNAIHNLPKSPSNLNRSANNNNMWSIISGILPGTKWCGIGDLAATYDDLGTDANLDKCCRAHDHCPTKVKSFRTRYGLVNWSLYTKSHCDCDGLLYECLKKSMTPTADILGNFYFNVIKVQCMEEEATANLKCIAQDGTGDCKVWQPDVEQPKRYRFRLARSEY